MSTLIQLWRRGSAVRRYHTMDTLVTDTVGKHSGGVAIICVKLMGTKITTSLMLHALMHDLAEYVVGDIPSPSKKLMDTQAAEREVLDTHGVYLPPLTDKEQAALEYADAADGALYCAEEMARGNVSMKRIFTAYIEYLNHRAQRCAEVDVPHIADTVSEVIACYGEILHVRK